MSKDNKIAAAERGISCWNCDYQQIAGNTFLGKCTFFSKHRRKEDKEIPPKVVDVGCKHFVQREMSLNKKRHDTVYDMCDEEPMMTDRDIDT
jgi:hypothetical protein